MCPRILHFFLPYLQSYILTYIVNLSDHSKSSISRVFLLRQIWIVKYYVKYSTVDCKYLLFLQDFFFRLKPKQYKKCQYCRLFKKYLETHKTKQTNCWIIWQETVRKIIILKRSSRTRLLSRDLSSNSRI